MNTPEWVEVILIIGSVAAAITGVTALSIKIVKGIRNVVKSCRWIIDSIKTLLEHSTENHMDILRLTVMNSEMPLSERIIAGKRYLDAGGNGDVKHYIEDHLLPHDMPANHQEFCPISDVKKGDQDGKEESKD